MRRLPLIMASLVLLVGFGPGMCEDWMDWTGSAREYAGPGHLVTTSTDVMPIGVCQGGWIGDDGTVNRVPEQRFAATSVGMAVAYEGEIVDDRYLCCNFCGNWNAGAGNRPAPGCRVDYSRGLYRMHPDYIRPERCGAGGFPGGDGGV